MCQIGLVELSNSIQLLWDGGKAVQEKEVRNYFKHSSFGTIEIANVKLFEEDQNGVISFKDDIGS